MTGRIVKALADFYYVYSEGNTYQCKAKGIFRKKNHTPLVGDIVEFELTNAKDIEGNVVSIEKRKNELFRPNVANIDFILLVFAIKDPEPNFYLLDRFLAIMESLGLEVIIVFNKIDLDKENLNVTYSKIYEEIGYRCISVCTKTGEGITLIKNELRGKTASVAGPSGVGKSSIINSLSGKELMETGQVSEKNKRGKQTTRHTELLSIDDNSYIVDTPGFSSTDISGIEIRGLADCFLEFKPYLNNCRFSSCLHASEPDCAVKEALNSGLLPTSRYDNYLKMLEELNKLKQY